MIKYHLQQIIIHPWRDLFWRRQGRIACYVFIGLWLWCGAWIICFNHLYWHIPPAGASIRFFIQYGILWLILTGIAAMLYPIYSQIACLFANYSDLVLVFITCQAIIIAMQMTPFLPIDHWLLYCDSLLGIHIDQMWQWVQHHHQQPFWRFFYFSLVYQLLLQPILGLYPQLQARQNKYLLMNILGFFGMFVYFFFPTCAPAAVFPQLEMQTIQQQIWERWYVLHHLWLATPPIQGLIAFPSFHVFWALMVVWYVWPVLILRYLCLFLNMMLAWSTMMLGCHYAVDILGSCLLFYLCWLGQEAMLGGTCRKPIA